MKSTFHTQKHLSSASELINLMPDFIHCSDDCSRGVYQRNKDEALRKKLVQINTWKKPALLFDIDQGELSAGLWTDFGLQPTWVAKNKESGNCHYGYALEKPVICNHYKPQNYFANVQYAMNHLFSGDTGYTGMLTKNPLHSHHEVLWYGNLYDLKTLAGASIPFAPPKPKRKRVEIDLTQVNNGERNVSMFHEVSGVAYVEVRKFRNDNRVFSWFYEHMLELAVNMNYILIEPLTLSEVKHITVSVCKWTFEKDPSAEEKFRKRQSARGRKGGIQSGIKRRVGSLMELKPWEIHNISERTFFRWVKAGKVDRYGNLLEIQ